jgi:predicted RNase H-like nuclease (RuvC/YqgF family)
MQMLFYEKGIHSRGLYYGKFFFSKAAIVPADSAQLKDKMEQVEKLVKQLQAEIKTLKTTDSTLTAELSSLRQSIPMKKEKKLVIDRRGSKQAYFQIKISSRKKLVRFLRELFNNVREKKLRPFSAAPVTRETRR